MSDASHWERIEVNLCEPARFGSLLAIAWLCVSFLYADRGLPPNDEGALLTNAARVLRGAVYYRDLDAYPFPGATYLLALVMTIFGEQVNVARGLAVAVSLAAVLALYATALQLLDRRRAAAFGVCLLSLKFVAWPAFTAYMYSDVAFAFGCTAIALLVRADAATSALRTALAGVCVGAAVLSKQNLGIALALATFTLLLVPQLAHQAARRDGRARFRSGAAFGLGVALPVGFMLLYFALHGAAGTMLESGLIRPFTSYLPTSGIGFAEPLRWWQLGSLREVPGNPYFSGPFLLAMSGKLLPAEGLYPLYWMVAEVASRALYSSIPLAFAAALFAAGRFVVRGALSADRAASLRFAGMAAAVMASAWPRADFYHVISVYPVVLLLLFDRVAAGRGAGEPTPPGREAGSSAFASNRAGRWIGRGALVSLLVVTGCVSGLHQSSYRHHLDLDRADLYISPYSGWVRSIVDLARAELEPGDPLFVYGHEAALYFLAERFSTWRFAQLYPGQVGEGRGSELANHLRAHPPAVIIRGGAGSPPLASYTPELLSWVLDNYEVDERVFEQYPPRARYVPPRWLVAVMRRGGGEP